MGDGPFRNEAKRFWKHQLSRPVRNYNTSLPPSIHTLPMWMLRLDLNVLLEYTYMRMNQKLAA